MKKMMNRIAVVLLAFWLLPQSVDAARLLMPVGQVIGLVLEDNSVSVAAFDEELGDAAQAAGLRVGDQIIRIDDTDIRSADDIHTALAQSDGTVDVRVLREGKDKSLRLTPEISQDGPKLGIYLKQGVTGIGTVTWYDPESGAFGALGHGVNNPSGELLEMEQGTAYQAAVVSVKKGMVGTPGQLMGTLKSEMPIGALKKNTEQGVFGQTETGWQGICLPTAEIGQIRTGQAHIRANIQGNAVQEYSVEILKIYPHNRTNGRNMLLKVTDPALLEATGGIVQGMSGSPIIQDGKLIGAITHVLVNDPTMGYGIFIENMLEAAS